MVACERIDDIGHEQTEADPLDESDPAADDAQLRLLLRTARRLRDREDPASVALHKQVWVDILELEMYTINERVVAYGYRKFGRRTVDEEDQGEVVGFVMQRMMRLSKTFDGTAIGQWRQAMNQAIEWEVTTYARREARRHENELAVEPAAWDPGSMDPEDRPAVDLSGIAAAGAVGDRIEMLEQLQLLGILKDRDMQVVTMRSIGHSSKEVAVELGLTPANVDQIYHRALKRLHDHASGEGDDV